MDVTKRLKQLMDERGMTMYTLSQRSGVSWTTIKNYFGRGTTRTVATMELRCNGLGITMAQFFDESCNTVHLTAEQQHLLDRWTVLSDEERKIVDGMLDVMVSKK